MARSGGGGGLLGRDGQGYRTGSPRYTPTVPHPGSGEDYLDPCGHQAGLVRIGLRQLRQGDHHLLPHSQAGVFAVLRHHGHQVLSHRGVRSLEYIF